MILLVVGKRWIRDCHCLSVVSEWRVQVVIVRREVVRLLNSLPSQSQEAIVVSVLLFTAE